MEQVIDQQADNDKKLLIHAQLRRYNILWILLIILFMSCMYQLIQNRYYVARPIEINNELVEQLNDKINPNKASWASLVRLPGIGPTKARAIVEYRESKINHDKINDKPFNSINDLENVKGIGPKTVEGIREYLIFE